ncbi:ferredoxin--NADP reductase [Rhodococcoides kyotonense]|uniref:3-ketosteroid 9alpha-monooxygenase subunit B n=1 Tax=Rhodococcoides kyotonense TaxID=398843 RepID=A0A239ITA7_9NOCA|nr:ferredoxin--NADP reductase [Rhodococcus kyotonensis]SNS96827.1 3-ketosteroid 9alpha-monooxygenase subunit B [Rhodococcus kyotonensis]
MTLVESRTLGVELEIRDVVQETPDAVSIVFDGHVDYTPGQFLTLRVPSEQTEFVARCYSLASSPATDSALKVTVKRTRDGYASNWLCDNAEPGLRLRILPPSGTFTAVSFEHDLSLFAGGSGITPIISILKSALATSTVNVALFYANRDRVSVIFDDELAELEDRYPGRIRVVHWLESERGIPGADDLRAFAGPVTDSHAYICGPGPFMAAVESTLHGLGVEHVHVERFVSLSGDPFTLSLDTEPSAASSTVSVELDGEQHSLEWPSKSTLIDVLLAAGIDAPYSCREGECGSCACTLRSGTVDPGNITALAPEDVDDGYILACQAKPTSPHLDVEF